jgi:hypothetical protein
VKLYELQYETKWSVLKGRGWGYLELMLIQVARLPNEKISYSINDNFHLGLSIFLRKPEAYKSGAQRG